MSDRSSKRLLVAGIAALLLVASCGTAVERLRQNGLAAAAAGASCATASQVEAARAAAAAAAAAANVATSAQAAADRALAEARAKHITGSRLSALQQQLAAATSAAARAAAAATAARTEYARLSGSRCADAPAGTSTSVAVEYVSSSATRTNGSVAGDADTVEFKVSFKVTAVGGDAYVDGDVVKTAAPSLATDGLSWFTTPGATTGTSSASGIVSAADGYKSGDTNASGDKRFKVSAGASRVLTLTVSIPAGADNTSAGVLINGIKWDAVSQDQMGRAYGGSLADFRTDTVTGLYIR